MNSEQVIYIFNAQGQPLAKLLRVANRCRKPDPLDIPTGHVIQSVKKAPEVDSTFRFDKRMHLIDDNKPEVFKVGRKIPFEHEDFEGLRGDHQEMWGFPSSPGPVSLRYIAMPFLDFKAGRDGKREEPAFLVIDECF